jgi:hypothetical protein
MAFYINLSLYLRIYYLLNILDEFNAEVISTHSFVSILTHQYKIKPYTHAHKHVHEQGDRYTHKNAHRHKYLHTEEHKHKHTHINTLHTHKTKTLTNIDTHKIVNHIILLYTFLTAN